MARLKEYCYVVAWFNAENDLIRTEQMQCKNTPKAVKTYITKTYKSTPEAVRLIVFRVINKEILYKWDIENGWTE